MHVYWGLGSKLTKVLLPVIKELINSVSKMNSYS